MRKHKHKPNSQPSKALSGLKGQQTGGGGFKGIGNAPMPPVPSSLTSPPSPNPPHSPQIKQTDLFPSPYQSPHHGPIKEPAKYLNNVDLSLSERVTKNISSLPKVRIPKDTIITCRGCLRMIGHFTKDLHKKEHLDLSYVYLTLQQSKKVDQRKWTCPKCGTPYVDGVGAVSTSKGWL